MTLYDTGRENRIKRQFKIWDGERPYQIVAESYHIDDRGYLLFYVDGEKVAAFNHDKWIDVELVRPEPPNIASLIRNALVKSD